MNGLADIGSAFGLSWRTVLRHLSDAVLVIDRERNLLYANDQARRLLGYDPDDPVSGRCRHTTKGLDCDTSCPVTFALEQGLEVVEGFSTEYRTRDGEMVPVRVTVVLLKQDHGGHGGHLEILRPAEPDPGFYLAGNSLRAVELRRRLTRLARSRSHLALVGEGPARADVVKAVHRFAGLDPEQLRVWRGSWDGVPCWPPGTMVVEGDEHPAVVANAPSGWRVIASLADRTGLPEGVEVVELPEPARLREDLPIMLAAWVERLQPGLRVAPEAMARLCRLALDRGLARVGEVLAVVVPGASSRLEEQDLPVRCYSDELVHQLLEQTDPLGALERTLLREAVERCGWRMQEAADRLGISRVTLWRKLREHAIVRGSPATTPSHSSGVLVKR